jgi:hypothetical protein
MELLTMDALPPEGRLRLRVVDVALSAGQVLCECDNQVSWAYFPTNVCGVLLVHNTGRHNR